MSQTQPTNPFAEMQAGRPLTTERIADLGIAIEEVRAFITRMLSNELA